MLPAIKIGEMVFSTYWLMFYVGVLSMGVLMVRRRDRYHLSLVKALVVTGLITFFGMVGAKMLGALQNWGEVQEKGLSAAGFSFFGAVYMVPIGLVLCSGLLKIKRTVILDAIAPCLASIVAFMRVGCFCSGCCGGWEAEMFGFRFRWPTQAVESIGDFIVLSILLQMEEKKENEGKRYAVFLMGYGILRFFVEFFRDTKKGLFGLGDGQGFAILSVMIAVLVLHKRQLK